MIQEKLFLEVQAYIDKNWTDPLLGAPIHTANSGPVRNSNDRKKAKRELFPKEIGIPDFLKKKRQTKGPVRNSEEYRAEKGDAANEDDFEKYTRKSVDRETLFGLQEVRNLEDLMELVEESFSKALLRMIDEKGMTDVEVHKRAGIDRKLFSKICCNLDYTPRKQTATALAMGLELNLDETIDFLDKAGYIFSHSNKRILLWSFLF